MSVLPTKVSPRYRLTRTVPWPAVTLPLRVKPWLRVVMRSALTDPVSSAASSVGVLGVDGALLSVTRRASVVGVL